MKIKKVLSVILLLFLHWSCQAQLSFYNIQMPQEWKDEGETNKVTLDNTIYKPGHVFKYSYTYINSANKEVVSAIAVDRTKDGPIPWKLINKGAETFEDYPVENIDIIVYRTKTNKPSFLSGQTIIRYKYYNKKGEIGFGELTGLIEDSKRVWLHPPRSFAFKITEFNPFPEVVYPLEIGNQWDRMILIPKEWATDFDFTINGTTTFDITYQITKKEKIKTKLGVLECYIIEAVGKGELGETKARFYFNERKGFVKLDYQNIDKSKLSIELVKIKK